MWMTDKPQVQEEVAGEVAELLHVFTDRQSGERMAGRGLMVEHNYTRSLVLHCCNTHAVFGMATY